MNQKALSPLYYCYPNQELARLYIEYGADASILSLTKVYATYLENLAYLDFAIT